MSDDKTSATREGLVDKVSGKAKEMAGAVTGNADLVQEGTLQQEEARHRKEAVAEESVAEAKRDEAVERYRRDRGEATERLEELSEATQEERKQD